MKRLLWVWTILILGSNVARSETFKISGQWIEFSEKDGLLLNGCNQGNCEALAVIKKNKTIDLKNLRKKLRFDNSVGSDTCHLAYQAKIVIGITHNRDQRGFCLFKDRSMVEANSLGDYLVSKKMVILK